MQENKNGALRKETKEQMPFGRKNYIMMAVCLGLIILGFLLMAFAIIYRPKK